MEARRPRKLPRWMLKDNLACDEVIVNRVPALTAITAAKVIKYGLSLKRYPRCLLVNIDDKKLTCVVRRTWYSTRRNVYNIKRPWRVEDEVEPKPRPAYKALYDGSVVNAWPYEEYDAVHKSEAKTIKETFFDEEYYISRERKLLGIRPIASKPGFSEHK